MAARPLTMLATGDMILGPEADTYFTFIGPVLKSADVVVGQLEVPYTARDANAAKLGRLPENLHPLITNNFHLMTLAGNHLADAGVEGIEDTIAWLRSHGIAHVGAGMNLREAREHIIIERDGTRFGFLNYNCVGPEETWASASKPGNAYVKILTHYELDYASPGGPPKIYTRAEPATLRAMKEDIRRLRPLCDILTVALHKGQVHTPVKVEQYERQLSYAAIDAGADLIVSHHAHILRGVEFYKGKPIFHGLCNGVAYLPMQAFSTGPMPDNWAQRRKAMFGFEPDPEYVTYPFHPEAKLTMLAKCVIEDRQLTRVSCIPCYVNKHGQPEVLRHDARGQDVFDYLARITQGAALNGKYRWDGDEITVYAD